MIHKFYVKDIYTQSIRIIKVSHNNRYEALRMASQRIKQHEYITNKDERFNN